MLLSFQNVYRLSYFQISSSSSSSSSLSSAASSLSLHVSSLRRSLPAAAVAAYSVSHRVATSCFRILLCGLNQVLQHGWLPITAVSDMLIDWLYGKRPRRITRAASRRQHYYSLSSNSSSAIFLTSLISPPHPLDFLRLCLLTIAVSSSTSRPHPF